MILRSLTKHVKDQNWFAVGLDFAIVVIGVFIGIQVANWNELQAEKAQTQRMLSELMTDIADMRVIVAGQRNYYRDNALALDALITSLEADDDIDPNIVRETFSESAGFAYPPLPPAGLDELLVVSRLDLLEETPLRDALRELAKQANFGLRISNDIAGEFVSLQKLLRPFITIDHKPDAEGDLKYVSISAVDIDALWSNAEARRQMIDISILHSNMQYLAQETLDSIDAVIATRIKLSQK